MKKAILVLAVFGAIAALGFSEKFWVFESGSRDLGGRFFGRISVINKTGEKIEVAGEVLENNSEALYFEDAITISCRLGNYDSYEAVYFIEGDHLQVVICRRGSYRLDARTFIFPPMLFLHNPPPPKRHKQYDHPPAPKKPQQHAPNERGRKPDERKGKPAPNQKGGRPPKPNPPKRRP